MRKILIISLTLLAITAGSANAQWFQQFTKKKAEQEQSQTQQPQAQQQQQAAPAPAPMQQIRPQQPQSPQYRNFQYAPQTQNQQQQQQAPQQHNNAPTTHTPIGKDTANVYYQNCMKGSDPRLTRQSQDAMCACTAAQMMQSMSIEEMMIMAQETQEGRLALNKMLLNVYAPCMEYPVYDLVNGQCMNDPKVSAIGATTISKDKLCNCMAEKTGKWFARDGRTLMADLIKENPNITDPISPIMESKVFNEKAYDNLRLCLKGR